MEGVFDLFVEEDRWSSTKREGGGVVLVDVVEMIKNEAFFFNLLPQKLREKRQSHMSHSPLEAAGENHVKLQEEEDRPRKSDEVLMPRQLRTLSTL